MAGPTKRDQLYDEYEQAIRGHDLRAAIAAAGRVAPKLNAAEALPLLALMAMRQDLRYEVWAGRWLGRALVEHPIPLASLGEMLTSLLWMPKDPNRERNRLARMLRQWPPPTRDEGVDEAGIPV